MNKKIEILPSERKIFNSIIDMAFKKNDELEKINQEQALEIARLRETIKKITEVSTDSNYLAVDRIIKINNMLKGDKE